MHLPAPSPPLRGLTLRLLCQALRMPGLRRLILQKVRRDAGIPALPDRP